MNINQKINHRSKIKDWARHNVLSLKRSASKNAQRTGDLLSSINGQLMLSNDVIEYTFQYQHYGLFVDMEVGKGRSLAQSIAGRKSRRKSKGKQNYLWSTRIIESRTKRLGGLLSKLYAEGIMDEFIMPHILELKMK